MKFNYSRKTRNSLWRLIHVHAIFTTTEKITMKLFHSSTLRLFNLQFKKASLSCYLYFNYFFSIPKCSIQMIWKIVSIWVMNVFCERTITVIVNATKWRWQVDVFESKWYIPGWVKSATDSTKNKRTNQKAAFHLMNEDQTHPTYSPRCKQRLVISLVLTWNSKRKTELNESKSNVE